MAASSEMLAKTLERTCVHMIDEISWNIHGESCDGEMWCYVDMEALEYLSTRREGIGKILLRKE